jgi:hypothetical protein
MRQLIPTLEGLMPHYLLHPHEQAGICELLELSKKSVNKKKLKVNLFRSHFIT